MKPFNNKSCVGAAGRALIVASLLASGICSADVIEIDGEHYVRTDRYTLVSIDTKPEQMSPLLSVVDIQFSNNIRTIGGALTELLEGSGYRWKSTEQDNQVLGQLPLPVVVRQIGPVRLRDALVTIAGSAWHLNVDELNRAVWFEPVESATRNRRDDQTGDQSVE